MKKSMKVLVAMLALAALATPAFALEHEVSGKFTSFYAVSNFTATGALEKSAPTANWFDQRVRFFYNAKADNNVKLVSKFELDYSFYGNSSFSVGRNQGAGIGADSVQIETKNLYLDWTLPTCNLNAKVGMQSYDDAFSGIIFGTDMAGILLSHNYSKANASLGFFRWEDAAGTGQGGANTPAGVPGAETQDLVVVDGQYAVNNDLKVGAAYYYIQDGTNPAGDAKVHTLGLNAKAALGAVNVNAFLLGQTGDFNATADAKGYAAKLAANTAIGTGTLRADVLYVAGGKNQLYVTRDQNGYYDNEMMILSRDKNATTIDNALVQDLNNKGEGAIMAAIGFDQPFTPTFTASANVGFGAVADNQGDDIAINSDKDYIGTEVNVELVKKATDNVTLTARAAYVFLGDHNMGDLDNPYAANLILGYKF
jgi:hypothetical protein